MVLAAMIAALLLAATVTRARSFVSIPLSALSWVLAGLRGLPLLGRTLTATSRMPLLWPVLRTVAIAAVGLVLFGGLFASGDAIFGSWAQSLVPDLRWDSIIARVFVFVFVAGVALAGAYLALNPPRIADLDVPRGAPGDRTAGSGSCRSASSSRSSPRSSWRRRRRCGAVTSTCGRPPA